MMALEQDLLTVQEAAKLFGVPVATIRDWIQRRVVKKYQREIGKRVYVDATEIREKLTPRQQD